MLKKNILVIALMLLVAFLLASCVNSSTMIEKCNNDERVIGDWQYERTENETYILHLFAGGIGYRELKTKVMSYGRNEFFEWYVIENRLVVKYDKSMTIYNISDNGLNPISEQYEYNYIKVDQGV